MLLDVVIALSMLLLGSAVADSRPNILFLMTDQHRFNVLGSAGNTGVHTPNLDWLASEGVRFENAYSSTPICTPARAALLTGLSPWYHGMLGYGVVAPEYAYEMPRALSSSGYYAQSIGKDHFGWNDTTNAGIPHGFNATQLYDGLGNGFANSTEEYDNYDRWFQQVLPGKNPLATGEDIGMNWNAWRSAPYVYPEYYHPTSWVGREAVDWLNTYERDEPFFLKVSFHRPHSPYDPPGRLLNSTHIDDLPPLVVGGNWDDVYHGGKGYPPGCGPEYDQAWCGAMPMEMVNQTRRAYYAQVEFVDEQVGEILATLKQRGVLNNTFILFTSDHGDAQGDHYLWRKAYPYEFSAHVPMIVRWHDGFKSAVPRGTTLPQITEMRDVMPTFLDVAGIIVPPSVTINGTAVTCLLRDPSGASCGANGWRTYIDMEMDLTYNETIHWNGLTDGKTKYVFFTFFPSEQLFDLVKDPHEMNNVAGDPAYADTLATWRQRLVEQFERESRGPDFVQHGVLQRRTQSMLYSPNYPGSATRIVPDIDSTW